MNDAITMYFDGEKNGGLVLVAYGVAVGGMALVLFRFHPQFRALAITLALWAALQLTVGIGLYLKTDAQVSGLVQQLSSAPERFYAEELVRMARVQKNFVVIELVWLVMLVGAGVGSVLWKSHATVNGIALGVVVNAALMLAFDVTAERRGSVYFAALQQGSRSALVDSVAPAQAQGSAPR